jgi:HPt (histidine-containing phosphotransfer) domain-containing protein
MHHRQHPAAVAQGPTRSLPAQDNSPPDSLDAAALARFRDECDAPGAILSDEILELYLSQLNPRVAAIVEATKRPDATALTHAAHALKGSSVLVGALPMAELCDQLEQAGRNDTISAAQSLLTPLQREASRLAEALEAVIARSKESPFRSS